MKKATLYVVILFVLALSVGVSIMVHQYLTWHHIIDVDQMMHHEFFAGVFVAFSLGVGVTVFMLTWGKRN